MKKILLILLLSLPVFMLMDKEKASAQVYNYPNTLEIISYENLIHKYPQVVIVNTTVNRGHILFPYDDTGKIVTGASVYSSTGFAYLTSTEIGKGDTLLSRKDLRIDWTQKGLFTSSYSASGNVNEVYHSTLPLYSSSTSNQPFFAPPPPPYLVAEKEGLKMIPQTMKQTMVDGGVLSVALMVFAILLGVGLVPRLLYSFSR